ncbi:BAG family molecular chaperone regulator 2-like [Mercurialis annua]|uniref:BAG family molecular chaperone regulator 2-like n=1 Tax=Mercurialis annua TaxID=3986 RepID=UPI00215E0B0C|nr:BAG family molecular chaperone regulator 2-like [Mercurialis annua]
MMKFRSKRFCRGSFKFCGNNNNKGSEKANCENIYNNSEVKWEVRPGGMLVQKRDSGDSVAELISINVSTLSHFHLISIEATSTFGELKMVLSLVSGLEPREQRLLFKGKEREDSEYLHMVGVRDKDKVFLLEDPAIKEMKLHSMPRGQSIGTPCITV